jgi:O-acetyl-ADP-ribose deacetylase (regulator of RNase III)
MIEYLYGDATKPERIVPDSNNHKYIAHGCNNIQKWGKGFVLAISKRWKEPKREYLRWGGQLGEIQIVNVEEDISVVNMITQHHIYSQNGVPPIRYEAVDDCFATLTSELKQKHPDGCFSIHMPRIGCGLAKGTWRKIGPIVEKNLDGLEVYVYDFD